MLRGSHRAAGATLHSGAGAGDAQGARPHCPLPPALGGMEVRWCTTSDPEQQKCSDMSKAFQDAGIQPALLCVQGTSADHCVQLITVSPLPSTLPPPPPRREGSDSGGSAQWPHSLGTAPTPSCRASNRISCVSPATGPVCFLPGPRPGAGRPREALLRWAPVGKGVLPQGPCYSQVSTHPTKGSPDSRPLSGPWWVLTLLWSFPEPGLCGFWGRRSRGQLSWVGEWGSTCEGQDIC